MSAVIKEECYVIVANKEEFTLEVQEFLSGAESPAERFRVQIPACAGWNGLTVFGSTSKETAEAALAFLLALSAVKACVAECEETGKFGPN